MPANNPPVVWRRVPTLQLINDDFSFNKFIVTSGGIAIWRGEAIVFPKGWVTDVASTPVWARGLFPQLGPHSPAALLHDRMLDTGRERSLARTAMLDCLNSLSIGIIVKASMYVAVFLWDQWVRLTGR